MSEPYNSLHACQYGKLNAHTPVWNLSASDDTIWVKIPSEYILYSLYKVDDISGKQVSEVDIFGKFQQSYGFSWISFPTKIFNMNPGKHTYKLYFSDQCNQPHTLFVSYICQDDDPMTPYIYMKNRGNTSEAKNEWKQGKYATEYFKEFNKAIEKEYPKEVHPIESEDESTDNTCCNCCKNN